MSLGRRLERMKREIPRCRSVALRVRDSGYARWFPSYAVLLEVEDGVEVIGAEWDQGCYVLSCANTPRQAISNAESRWPYLLIRPERTVVAAPE